MKKIKIISLLCLVLMLTVIFAGCANEAERVSYNLSQQADNFNVVRRLTVINCLQGDTLFLMEGKMSIKADPADNQLEIVVEDDDGTYKKHFVGLSDNVTYTVEDVSANYVNKYKYTIYFNPKMWFPHAVELEPID